MAFMDPITLIGTASLIVQIIVLILLFVGYTYKRKLKYRTHGAVMATALLLHLVTIFVIMVPSLVLAVFPAYFIPAPYTLESIVTLIHGVAGTLAAALGIFLVAAWGIQRNVQGCFKRKKFMRLTLTVWLVALIFGILVYEIFYGPLLLS